MAATTLSRLSFGVLGKAAQQAASELAEPCEAAIECEVRMSSLGFEAEKP